MSEQMLGTRMRLALTLLGTLVAALGLAVIAGWHLRLPALIQIHAALVPMQYNTALAFVLCGAAVIAFARRAFAWLRLAAGASALLGAASGAQYLLGADFGIDQLLMQHHITTHTPYPGRMAGSTSAAFVLAATGWLFAGAQGRIRYAVEVASLLGAMVFALAAATLVGYAAELRPLIGWGKSTYMALHTAFGHLMLGGGLVLATVGSPRRHGADSLQFAGVLSFGGILILSLLLWSGLERNQSERLAAARDADARWFAGRIEADYREQVKALERMAQRIEVAGGMPRRQWEADAAGYINDLSGVEALEWADAGGYARWKVPSGDVPAQARAMERSRVRSAAIAQARASRAAVASEAVALLEGGEGFLWVRPVVVRGQLDGYLIAAFRIESMIERVAAPNLMFGEAFVVERDGRAVYRSSGADEGRAQNVATTHMPLMLGDGRWALRFGAGLEERAAAESALPLFVLASGAIVAFFLGAVFRLWALTVRRARAEARASAALAESEARLRSAQRIARLGYFHTNLRTGTLEWSDEVYNIMGHVPNGIASSFENFSAFIHPDDREWVLGEIGRAYARVYPTENGAPVALPTVEFRAVHASGSLLWVRSEAQAELDTGGRPALVQGTVQDITERKHIEETLAEQQQSLRLALDASRAGFYVLDLVRGRAEWDDRAYAAYGQSRDRFDTSFENIAGVVIPEDRDMLTRFGALLQSAGTDWHQVYRVRAQDGSIRTIEGFGYVVRAPDNTPLKVIGTVVDITARDAAEAQLRETTQLLDSVVENIPAMIFMKRASDLRFTLFNKAGEDLTGFARAELLGKNDYDFFPKEQADFFTRKDRQVLERGFEDIPEEPIDTRARGRRLLHTRKIALRDEQGRPQFLLGISHDITDEKAAGTALRESAARMRAVLDNVVDGIITIDEAGIVETFNRSAEHIFGFRADEVIGRNVSMLMPEPYASQHDGYLARYRAGGAARVIGIGREVEGRRKDGSVFPLDLAVSAVQLGGRRIFTGMVRDITERKKIERLKSEFISTVSHELRTPLTSIRGSLGLLAGGALGEMPAKTREVVQIANKNVERLSHLINDILDIEKIAAGSMKFARRAQPLMPLVEQAIVANRGYAEEFGVRFRVLRRIEDGEVTVDGERFQQVMANLLSNAAKFSPRGTAVDVSVEARADAFQVAVTDRGPGIPAAFRPRVFERFSQADASDTRVKGGTGLGLAISREIVERMGGAIGFESEEGIGTTFYVEFPASRAADAIETVAPPGSGRRILIAEDDPDVARLLAMMLRNAGFATDTAPDAGSAKRLLAARNYQAMTLDLVLPVQDGVSLIRELRAAAATRELPIVVVSARVEEGQLAVNGDFAAVDWLGKPVDEQRLIRSIRTVIGRVRGYRPRILHVADDIDLHHLTASIAGDAADFDHARSLSEAREKLALGRYALVVLDLALPDGSGWELLAQLCALDPPPPLVVLSGHEISEQEASSVEAALAKAHTGNVDLLNTLQRIIRDAGRA